MRGARYSDEELLAGLREAAAELGEPLTSTAYDAWQRRRGAASPALLVRRFGSWNAACAAAGLTSNTTRSTSRRWTDEAVVAIVARYLTEAGSGGSFAGYAAWAKAQADVPSGATLRQRFRWSELKELATRRTS